MSETTVKVLAIACLAALIVITVKALAALIEHLSPSCRHEDVWEMRNCDVMCRDCSKNCGFIETWRKDQIKKGRACRSTPL